jgi:hypothetical protein
VSASAARSARVRTASACRFRVLAVKARCGPHLGLVSAGARACGLASAAGAAAAAPVNADRSWMSRWPGLSVSRRACGCVIRLLC